MVNRKGGFWLRAKLCKRNWAKIKISVAKESSSMLRRPRQQQGLGGSWTSATRLFYINYPDLLLTYTSNQNEKNYARLAVLILVSSLTYSVVYLLARIQML
jgi:hypothetical protein